LIDHAMPNSRVPLRLCAGLFACILGLQTIWIVAAEITRPRMPYFPVSGVEAKSLAADRAAASLASTVGWPRGDLWIDSAIAENAAFLADSQNAARANSSGPGPYDTVARAAALAPSDARGWVILAALSEQNSAAAAKAFAHLKMSYYTSPYNEALFPWRIQIASQLPADADEELRTYIKYEIGTVISRKPAAKLAIIAALKTSSPAGRKLLDSLLRELNLNPL
jgi:hypothetical protein